MEHIIREGDVDAKIFIHRSLIDKGTMSQIRDMIHHPSLSHIRIMPDCHRGKGCCVGFTSLLKDKVVPQYVGGDIGCGILTYPIGAPTDYMAKKEIDEIIRLCVRMGSGSNSVWKDPVVTDTDIENICTQASEDAEQFAKAFNDRFESNLTEYIPKYNLEWFTKFCRKIQLEEDYARRSLGSLGGGNHFIELNESVETGTQYLTIHSGSRSFGDKTCRYHQEKINETRRFDYRDFKHTMKKANRKFRSSKALKKVADQYRSEFEEHKHNDYLEEKEAYEYFFDMIFAQIYAQYNRRTMLKQIINEINKRYGNYIEFKEENVIESIHNYIDFKDFVMRKGAISSYADQKCLIALNMRDGILLCNGKSNHDWNYSAAHGAGRAVARYAANQKFSLKEFRNEMKKVYSTSVVAETIDEAPMAYKDTELIKECLGPTVDIIEQLKPIINVKALD